MSDSASSSWAFGGPLAKVQPEFAWAILGTAAALALIFAWVSYRDTVRPLGAGPRVLLMLLRSTLLVALLFCLANPVRIERQSATPPEPPSPAPPPRLAVVVDRSDSMTQPDNRGRSRLDEALATWRRIESAAKKHFGAAEYYSFAEDLRPAKTLEEAAGRTGETDATRLYQAMATLLKRSAEERADAIVVLTDGVDTSNDSESLVRDSAVAAGVPVYFVAGINRSARPNPFLRVREWRVPPTALRSSEFTIEATFEAFSRADHTVMFSVWQAGRRIVRDELMLSVGPTLVSRSFVVSASEPGPVEFALRVGPDDQAPLAARAFTEVLAPQNSKIRVLVYQSALDWGLRYFTNALRTDSKFEFQTLVAPDSGLTISGGSQPGDTRLGSLPGDAKALALFDCVVLMRVAPKRLTAAQQSALVEFVGGGGSVLFMSPDADSLPQFAESLLKPLLPVQLEGDAAVFATSKPAANAPKPAANALGDRFARMAGGGQARPPGKLLPFALTEAGAASPVFAVSGTTDGGLLLPRFAEHVKFHQPRAGAEILAVHPTSADAASGKPHILLATHVFGSGRAALLATDTLWRWKLDEPSESRAIETFWQQLLLAIGRRHDTKSLRFADTPAQVKLGGATSLRLTGTNSENLPIVIATAPDGRKVPLTVRRDDASDSGWTLNWNPDLPGVWELTATIDGAKPASIFPIVGADATGEHAPSVPAIDAMRALAGETGGMLLSHEVPPTWRETGDRPASQLDHVTSERTILRWNTWKVLCLALGCFGIELVLRRIWKLV